MEQINTEKIEQALRELEDSLKNEVVGEGVAHYFYDVAYNRIAIASYPSATYEIVTPMHWLYLGTLKRIPTISREEILKNWEIEKKEKWCNDIITSAKIELYKFFNLQEWKEKNKIEVEEEKEKRRWEILSIVNALIYKIKEYSYFLEDL